MSAIDEVVYLLEEAFRGRGIEETNESQSLLANLGTVTEPMWRATPPNGTRTIESIAVHVGSCKVMYDEHAFGHGRLTWDDAAVQPWPAGAAPRAETLAWLTRSHERMLDHVRGLKDEDLEVPRPANWGEMRPTRWLLATLIQHDTYHAGEINHLRALIAGDDRWLWG
jgi:uncharacterized damage-inducible protein DinB